MCLFTCDYGKKTMQAHWDKEVPHVELYLKWTSVSERVKSFTLCLCWSWISYCFARETFNYPLSE